MPVAEALRRQAADLIGNHLTRTCAEVEVQADLIEAFHREFGHRDLAWRLGLDGQVTDDALRRVETHNFFKATAMPTRARRR